jgi:hypothetical protein
VPADGGESETGADTSVDVETDAELGGSPARAALRALTALRPVLDRLEAALVDRARLDHCSWSEIGADLGTTKQTAHRRHGAHDPVERVHQPGHPDDWLTEGPTDEDFAVTRTVMRELGLWSGDPPA